MANKSKNYPIKKEFILIPDAAILCNEYKGLSLATRAAYIAMLTSFIRDKDKNPYNKLKMSHSKIQEIANIGHGFTVRTIKELKDKGFLKVSFQGGLYRRQSEYIMNGRYLECGDMSVRW